MKNITKKTYIKRKYGKIADSNGSMSCCNGGCSCAGSDCGTQDLSLKSGYTKEELTDAIGGTSMGLSCGNPLAYANLERGETVLDLGSGGGFDCFLAAKKVGESGLVYGVDMTPEMIALAKRNSKNLDITNTIFMEGTIENLPVENEIIDVIISNCVINLSENKEKVFNEAYRVLKKGGRLCISDIVATAILPKEIIEDMEMLSGCISGALFHGSLRKILEDVGFINVEMIRKDNSKEMLATWSPGKNIEDYVASFIIKAIKPF